MTELWAIISVLVAVGFGSLGPLYIKKGADKLTIDLRNKVNTLKGLIRNKDLYLGVTFYGLSSLIFIYALKGGELSVLYPLVATTYVWTAILAVKFLNEKMNRDKWTGILIIIIGVILIGVGSL